MYHGFLNIAKPRGPTSHDVVARVRRVAGQSKVGHAGTLDPAADGVLPVALGVATRLAEYLADGAKAYRARVRLGSTTDTDDAEGTVIATSPVPPLDQVTLAEALAQFVGTTMQVPPRYAALHHAGRRLYDLARAGQEVVIAPRPVTITSIQLITWEPPDLVIDVACGKGVYIRALARDLGAALGCGAHLAALSRTRVGPLSLDEAVPLADLLAAPAVLATRLLPPETAVAHWLRIDVDAAQAQRLRHGMPLVAPAGAHARARAHGPDGTLLALLEHTGEAWQPVKVFIT